MVPAARSLPRFFQPLTWVAGGCLDAGFLEQVWMSCRVLRELPSDPYVSGLDRTRVRLRGLGEGRRELRAVPSVLGGIDLGTVLRAPHESVSIGHPAEACRVSWAPQMGQRQVHRGLQGCARVCSQHTHVLQHLHTRALHMCVLHTRFPQVLFHLPSSDPWHVFLGYVIEEGI